MKYARAEERIFICTFPENCRTIKDNEIVAKADTIEELCDEFVVIGYGINGKPTTVNTTNGFKGIRAFFGGYEVYGAIWTDKGLIYVAKMNEKGELELL